MAWCKGWARYKRRLEAEKRGVILDSVGTSARSSGAGGSRRFGPRGLPRSGTFDSEGRTHPTLTNNQGGRQRNSKLRSHHLSCIKDFL